MDNNISQYQIDKDGKTFILSTELYLDNVRIRCKEINSINPIEFYSDFSLITLKQTNPVFTTAQTNIDI